VANGAPFYFILSLPPALFNNLTSSRLIAKVWAVVHFPEGVNDPAGPALACRPRVKQRFASQEQRHAARRG